MRVNNLSESCLNPENYEVEKLNLLLFPDRKKYLPWKKIKEKKKKDNIFSLIELNHVKELVISTENTFVLQKYVEHLVNLETLTLSNCFFNNDEINLSSLIHLKNLILKGRVHSTIIYPENIEKIYFRYPNSDAMLSFITSLKTNPTVLERLDAIYIDYTKDIIRHLTSLSSLKHFRVLDNEKREIPKFYIVKTNEYEEELKKVYPDKKELLEIKAIVWDVQSSLYKIKHHHLSQEIDFRAMAQKMEMKLVERF